MKIASSSWVPANSIPLSAYVPGRRQRKGRDEFLSRPRFLAISEFGPGAIIYHEGARYRVYKVNLDFGSQDMEATHELPTATMKRCPKCGYAHLEQGNNMAEVCDRCGSALDGPARIDNLVQLQNVSLRIAQRITCDEEERQRFGYKLVSSYRFPEVGGRLDRKDAEVYVGDTLVTRLSYGDATDLYRINLGWSHQRGAQPPGFNLELGSSLTQSPIPLLRSRPRNKHRLHPADKRRNPRSRPSTCYLGSPSDRPHGHPPTLALGL